MYLSPKRRYYIYTKKKIKFIQIITEILQLVNDLLGGVFDGNNVSDLLRYEVEPVAENYPCNYETKQWNWWNLEEFKLEPGVVKSINIFFFTIWAVRLAPVESHAGICHVDGGDVERTRGNWNIEYFQWFNSRSEQVGKLCC